MLVLAGVGYPPAGAPGFEIDALRPYFGLSGFVYSKELFELSASRLKPGGLVCTWAPTTRVERTFQAVFPHVLAFKGGTILLGSLQPIPVDQAAWVQRLEGTKNALAGVAVRLRPLLGLPTRLVALGVGATDLNLDLDPRDEFGRP